MDSPDGARPISQFIEVAAKDGNVLELSNTVHVDFPEELHPQVWNVRARETRYVGIEDLTIQGGTYDKVVMGKNTSYSWLANVDLDGDGHGFFGSHLRMDGFRNVIRDSYVHHSTNYDPGANAYGIVFEGTDCLIENNVAYALNKMIVGGFRHVPVVDDEHRPAFVISVRDIVSFLVEAFPREVLNLPAEGHPTPRQREGA